MRFEDVTSPETKIKYMTDGMLLREAISDPLLSRYSMIILDEVHERTIHTDILLGITKAAQQSRASNKAEHHLKPLKVILMSATMDVDVFSDYFNKAPVLYLEGRQFQVEVFHSASEQTDYLFSAIQTVFQIHKSAPPNEDILGEFKSLLNTSNSNSPSSVIYHYFGPFCRSFMKTFKSFSKINIL